MRSSAAAGAGPSQSAAEPARCDHAAGETYRTSTAVDADKTNPEASRHPGRSIAGAVVSALGRIDHGRRVATWPTGPSSGPVDPKRRSTRRAAKHAASPRPTNDFTTNTNARLPRPVWLLTQTAREIENDMSSRRRAIADCVSADEINASYLVQRVDHRVAPRRRRGPGKRHQERGRSCHRGARRTPTDRGRNSQRRRAAFVEPAPASRSPHELLEARAGR